MQTVISGENEFKARGENNRNGENGEHQDNGEKWLNDSPNLGGALAEVVR